MLKLYKLFSIRFLYGLLLFSVIFGCQKYEEDNFKPDDDGQLTTSIDGIIYDENRVELQGAKVTIGNSTTETNALGFFEINNVSVQSRFVIKVQKEGYFEQASESYISNANVRQHKSISLLKKEFVHEFYNGQGGNFNINKLNLNIPSNALGKDSLTPYNGKVKIAAVYYNPFENQNISLFSNTLGVNKQNIQTDVSSSGMIGVEFLSDLGEKLVLRKGTSVDLKIPISNPASTLPSAVATYWYLDTKRGLWVEEGSAVRNGNFWTISINRSGLWNVDNSEKMTTVSGRLMFETSPISNQRIFFKEEATSRVFVFVTNENGEFLGRLPSQKNYTLMLRSCGFVYFEQTIRTETGTLALSDIPVKSSILKHKKYKLFVRDCSSKPVSFATVFVRFMTQDSRVLKTDINGTAELDFFTIDNCNEFPTIQAVSPNGEKSEVMNISPSSTADLYLDFCPLEYVRCQVGNDTTFIMTNPKFTFSPISITAGEPVGIPNISIKGNKTVQTPGDVTVNEFSFTNQIHGKIVTITSTSGTISLQSFATTTSEYFSGSFKFEKTTSNGTNTGVVTGLFRIKRK